jgi:hypothetical protein
VEVENHGSTPAFLVGFDVKFDTLGEVRNNLKDNDPAAMGLIMAFHPEERRE